MTTINSRPTARGGKAVFVQRGGKGRSGAQSPPTASQPGSPALPQQQPVVKESPIDKVDAKHMHDRMLFLLMHMVGMPVQVTVKNGSVFEGLFHSAFTEGELGVVLRLAKAISGKDKQDSNPKLISQMIILAKDCMAINVVNVDFVPHEQAVTAERGEREGFKTDTDISRSGDIRERDLKKWAPEEYTSLGGIEDDLGTGGNSNTSWDQFAANEKLFGVRTDFDEEIYTTKLDRSGANYRARELQAIQIANEIQNSGANSNNVHMQEERNMAVDDSGMDEEDRYGAVVRDPLPSAPATNKYMPPAMRRQQEQLGQQRRPSTPTQQLPQPSQVKPATKATPPTQTTTAQLNKQQPQATSAQLNKDLASAPTTAAAGESPNRAAASSAKGQPFNLKDLRTTHNPVSALLNAATIQGSLNQKIPDHAVDSKLIEDNLTKFAMTVSDFTQNDKVLVKQTKMDLTQRRTELIKKEKDGLAAELIQFGRELTKKINTPVPDDVKEIFNKKPVKDASAATEKTSETSTAEKAVATNNISQAAPDAKKETPKTATQDKPASNFKFNIKASVFKPNVNAAPFTPSFAAASAEKKVDKNLFFGKVINKSPLPLSESMTGPFQKGKPAPAPNTIAPTWPYGQRPFRHFFQVTHRYDDDMYNPGQHGAGAYYPMAPYGYASGQYVPGGPPMTIGPNHMVPFMGPGPVPYSQPMPHSTGGPGFPPMTQTSGPPYPPQGFTGQGRPGMMPPGGMHMPMYPYPPNSHVGGPMMMRYHHPEMMQHMGPNGMMMSPHPMGGGGGMEGNPMMPYAGDDRPQPASPEEHAAGAPNS